MAPRPHRGAAEETKARYVLLYGDFRRVHRSGLIACVYRAAEWRHKGVEPAAHDLLQLLDRTSAWPLGAGPRRRAPRGAVAARPDQQSTCTLTLLSAVPDPLRTHTVTWVGWFATPAVTAARSVGFAAALPTSTGLAVHEQAETLVLKSTTYLPLALPVPFSWT